MYPVFILITAGPCLIMVLAALAMFVLGNTLARTQHARIWALSFAAEALHWALLALFHAGVVARFWVYVPISFAAVGGSFGYLAGFRKRGGKDRFRWLLAAAIGIATVQSALYLPPAPVLNAAGDALLSAQRAFAFLASAALVTLDRRSATATERAAIVVLRGMAAVDIGITALFLIEPSGYLPRGTILVALAFVTTPIAAIVGLFTLMLIASDFSRERMRLINTDPLTGLLNRAGFELAAQRAIARARPPVRPLSLVLADIDRFKTINDRFGHLTGDAALIGFARRITDGLPGTALIGRFGGEEFALVLAGQGAEATFDQIEAIRRRLADLAIPGGLAIDITASFGIAEQRPRETLQDLYARADAALYLSKQGGRDRCSIAAAAS